MIFLQPCKYSNICGLFSPRPQATDLLEVFGAEDEAALDAYLSLARFADTQYQNIVNHMNSATFEAKQALVMKAKVDAEQLRQIGEKNRLARNYSWP